MSKRAVWTTLMLGSAGLVLAVELAAALDGDPDTRTLTVLIRDHVPWPITAAAIAALIVWLPAHFVKAYRDKRNPS